MNNIQITYPESCLSVSCGNFGDACKGCPQLPKLEYFKRFNTKYKAYVYDCGRSGMHPMPRKRYAETLDQPHLKGTRHEVQV